MPDGSISETPVFAVKGQIGDHQIDMVAGVDEAYQETSIVVVNGIEFFTGAMTKGGELLTLSVSDGDIGLIPSIPDILPKNIPFSYPSGIWYSVSHNNFPNAHKIQSVNFSVDGIYAGSSIDIMSPGFHTVCADIVFKDGTSHSVCNNILLGYKDYGGFLVKSNSQTGGETTLWVETSLVAVAGVKWYVDNQYFSDISQITLNSGSGVVSVKAKVTFANGLVREHTVLVDTDGQDRNFSDMELFKANVPADFFNDFKISLTYKNGTGIFSSYSTPDSPGFFSVNSVTLFKEKANGNKIYKISGTIYTKLMNLLSGDLLSSQLEVVFAIELPY